MKLALFIAILSISLACCNEPKNITANPDNQAATSGTVGSAKMTNELPAKSDTSVVKKDTLQNR